MAGSTPHAGTHTRGYLRPTTYRHTHTHMETDELKRLEAYREAELTRALELAVRTELTGVPLTQTEQIELRQIEHTLVQLRRIEENL